MEDAKNFRDINRIAIIGAGNAGVTAAKFLVAEEAFQSIDIFEQRTQAGGVWIYNSANDVEDDFKIPQTTATAPLEAPIWQDPKSTSSGHQNGVSKPNVKEPTFISPLYERLESNLPKTIMQHSDLDFPEDSQLFPTHECVLEYLERYAEDVRHLVHFETQVQDIRRAVESERTVWRVTTRNLSTSEQSSATYDAVLIGSGHFTVPYVPDISGIREWNEAYPRSMSHSKHFRKPEEYFGKKTVTIGRGYSGLDIASQIADYAAKPLIISTYQPGLADREKGYVQHPEIVEFLPPSSSNPRAVRFKDGHVESNIDQILFCTGYMYSFPYLPTLTSSQSLPPREPKDSNCNESMPPIITDGARPHNLYQYMFYNADPTLAIISMPQQIVPFPIAEAQSAVIARAWAGRLELPSRSEMERWETEIVHERGEGKKWLWLKPPLDGRYLNELADWADSARPAKKAEVVGKRPARWGEKELWVRDRVMDIKKAFVEKGEGRGRFRTLEELGFDYEAWQETQGEGANGT